jgi:hypothetical protein
MCRKMLYMNTINSSTLHCNATIQTIKPHLRKKYTNNLCKCVY